MSAYGNVHLTSSHLIFPFIPLWSKTEKKHRKISHQIIYFPTSLGVSEVSDRANECAQRIAQAKQGGASERGSGASKRTSEWPSKYIGILGCLGPQRTLTFHGVKSQRDTNRKYGRIYAGESMIEHTKRKSRSEKGQLKTSVTQVSLNNICYAIKQSYGAT